MFLKGGTFQWTTLGANLGVSTADHGEGFNLAGFTLVVDPAATLTHGWYCIARGPGVIDPNDGSNVILATDEWAIVSTNGTVTYILPASKSPQITVATADITKADVTTAQNVFDTTADTAILLPNMTYDFYAEYQIDTTGVVSRTLSVLFLLSGGLSLTSIAYTARATSGSASGTPSASNVSRHTTAAVHAITAAVAAAAQYTVTLAGIIRTNAGGMLTPQFQLSALQTVAPVVRANSYFKLVPSGATNLSMFNGAWQ